MFGYLTDHMNNMSASAHHAEASFPCTRSASIIMPDAVIAASIIIIAAISISLRTALAVGLLCFVLCGAQVICRNLISAKSRV